MASEFLDHVASDDELLFACVDNHIELMRRIARASDGTIGDDQEIHDGAPWVHVRRPFTSVTVALRTPPSSGFAGAVDGMVNYCRAHDVESLSYWAVTETIGAVVGARLGARGFRWGGKPHWMALDLHRVPAPPCAAEISATVNATTPPRVTGYDVAELPCFSPEEAPVRDALIAQRPQRYWQVVFWSEGRPIGQISLNLTVGTLGVCGLNDAVFVTASRTRGPGLARLAWVRRFALDLGCRYLVLNAAQGTTGLYRLGGFRSLGVGQTFWLPGTAMANAPSSEQVAFAEAIGDGRLDKLPAALAALGPGGVDRPLTDTMTPLQFAARTGQPLVARWLQEHGAAPDLLAAWDLGWHDEARRIARQRPDLVTARRPRSGKTLLHVAVERDDLALIALLLASGADRLARDQRFHATPLEWARELRHPRSAAVLGPSYVGVSAENGR
jgi:Ankyrin repeat